MIDLKHLIHIEVLTCLLLLVHTAAHAQTPPSTPSANGTAEASDAICTDRPTKTNFACTVDAGHFQYESDLLNLAVQQVARVTSDTWLLSNPTFKYGLSADTDIEANLVPLELVRTRDASGRTQLLEGIGDLYLRFKYLFVNLDSGNLQLTALPYVKAPTARVGIGNGAVEGGFLVPINYKINSVLLFTTDPEIDVYKNQRDDARHLNTQQLLNLGLTLPHNVVLYGEFWADYNFDPAGSVHEYSADVALTYGPTATLQFDLGANFGLNAQTPSVQGYLGISQRF